MIKVCHMTSAHENDDARIYRLECNSLANNNFEVYLVAKGESKTEDNLHVIGIGEAPKSRLLRMISFSNKVFKKASSLDCQIYHLHDPELLPYALKLKKKGKIVIFDSHENTLEQMEEKEWIPGIFRQIISTLYRKYAAHVFKNIDCLVSVTPHIVNSLKAINPNTWMITNYPIYIDYPDTEHDRNHFCICFTGGIDSQWNHDFIINSIDGMTDVTYNLCGWGNDQYIENIKKLQGWRKVQYYGKVPFSTAVDIQRNSNVGVALLSPSRNTGGMVGTIGNTKLFEYMMAGLPIICTNFTLWREIIEKYHCGICVNLNSQRELMDAIIYLQQNKSIAVQMGQNGKQAVKSEFNWKTQEKILVEMYNSLIKYSDCYYECGEK